MGAERVAAGQETGRRDAADSTDTRSVVVTGASRGIGAAIARRLAARGMRVVLVARSEERLKALALELGGDAIALPCDLAEASALDRAVRTIDERLGGAPDVLVSNAGAFALAPAHEQDADAFASMLTVNLAGPFRLMRAWLPAMRARGTGHLVTIGSIADRVIFPGNAAYAASKYGLRALHEVLREELRGTGVRASLVSPAQVDTELWDPLDPDNTPGFTPRSRMLPPEAVAEAVAWVVGAPPYVNVDELRLSRA